MNPWLGIKKGDPFMVVQGPTLMASQCVGRRKAMA